MLILPENIVCGYWDCSEFGSLSISPKRISTRYEIEFYLEDGKTTFANNEKYKIQKNYIHITKPGQIRYSYLPFYTQFIKFDVEGEIAERLSKIPEHFCTSHPTRIYNMLDELILLSEKDNSLLLNSRLLSLLNLIFTDAEIPECRNGKNYETIIKAKRFIEENSAQSIRLSDMAHSVHLSETYFHNIFTESTGISPHQYLINCRIENAKKLLWDTKISVIEIAEKTGFGCQQYFNKVFKKETGLTPVSYRKSFQANYLL